jgi:hypothetical protein
MLNLLIKFQLKVHLRKGFFPFVAIEQSAGSCATLIRFRSTDGASATATDRVPKVRRLDDRPDCAGFQCACFKAVVAPGACL